MQRDCECAFSVANPLKVFKLLVVSAFSPQIAHARCSIYRSDENIITSAIFGIENNGLLGITALLTGAALVFLALWIAKLISPRSFNPQKGEAYECGIPTRGESMSQFKVGYYLFAILFLMFDVETVFLFPWAVRMRELGVDGLLCIAVFFGILVLGLVYAWRKGALEWK